MTMHRIDVWVAVGMTVVALAMLVAGTRKAARDERGTLSGWAAGIISLLLLAAGCGVALNLAISPYVAAASGATVTAESQASPSGSLAFIDGPSHEVMKHDRVTHHAHIAGTDWTYVLLRDGSEWLATPCPEEDSRNCWWNAAKRGNGEGTSFLNLHGHYHYVR